MNRTKRRRVVDAAIHWSIAAAIAGTIGTALMYKVIHEAEAKTQASECGNDPCQELVKRMAVIEQRLEDAEPMLTGSAPK